MFSMFRKSAATTVEPEETPVMVPARVAIEPSMDDAARAEYIEKAKVLGIYNGALKREMLLALLCENGLRVYPYDKVELYLDMMFGRPCGCPPDALGHYRECSTWGWHPLREKDDGQLVSGHSSANGRIQRGVYQQAVPLPVLLTVEKIVEAVPDVYFYVSGRIVPQTDDPFLAVSARGMSMLVIERWDEPSFRA